MTRPTERVAGAPITWGICEVPGWGHQLPPERVLEDMRTIGLRATELGPEGYLPRQPQPLRGLLGSFGLRLVGGFLPLTLHRADRMSEELVHAARFADLLAGADAEVVVLAAAADEAGYETATELDRTQWNTFVSGIDRIMELAADRGLAVALHPHYGTLIDGTRSVERVLESTTVPLCIDTGHLAVCGADPVEIIRNATERVAHVHLKDVDLRLADRLATGAGYLESVARGMFRPLGDGDVNIAEVVHTLEGSGYRGWYVLEQDRVVTLDPDTEAEPIRDARRSFAWLRGVIDAAHTDVSA
jgi:inosose dehydratase